ncbi:MAG: iron ABC transporter permease [Planctomycetota bacterium]
MSGVGTNRLGGLWPVAAVAVSLVVVVPVAVVIASTLRSSDGDWAHLSSTRLPVYAWNTSILAVTVCVAAAVIGTGTAWLVNACDFPGRRLLRWGLLLPLAIPGYLAAYAYTDLLQVSGPVQSTVRAWLGLSVADGWLLRVRSLPGAAAVLAITLYPYVYLAASAAFAEQSGRAFEVSRSLGRGPWRSFFSVALPLARPSIAAGTALVLMETLADFGAVDYCAVDTFATGVYRAWRSLESPTAAAQLAALLLAIVIVVLIVEWWTRRRARTFAKESAEAMHRLRLGPIAAAAAIAACATPILAGFVVPAGVFVTLAASALDSDAMSLAWEAGWRSIAVAATGASVAVVLALTLQYAARWRPGTATRGASAACRLGYALPGTVVGVGLLIPLTSMDHALNGVLRQAFGWQPGLVLTGTVAAVVIGYQTRFLAVALAMVAPGLERIRPAMDDAARTLGTSGARLIARVHLPLMRGSLMAALLLVFVECVKELPATLMLRPFNFDTLAVRAYQLASDERLDEASIAALAIIAIGTLPTALLAAALSRSRGRFRGIRQRLEGNA